jgi:hypothetical protein
MATSVTWVTSVSCKYRSRLFADLTPVAGVQQLKTAKCSLQSRVSTLLYIADADIAVQLQLLEREPESLSRNIPVKHTSKTEAGLPYRAIFFETKITMTFLKKYARVPSVILRSSLR